MNITGYHRIIMGIDPGIGRVGYAMLATDGLFHTLLACDVISTPKEQPVPVRLRSIYQRLHKLIDTFHPQEVAIESLFFGKNVSTAIAVGQARGIVLLVAAEHDLAVTEYTPSAVKLAVTGYGAATKQQVGEMVRQILSLATVPRPDDAADAAAIAICHAHTARLVKK